MFFMVRNHKKTNTTKDKQAQDGFLTTRACLSADYSGLNENHQLLQQQQHEHELFE